MVITGASAIAQALRYAAEWTGYNPDDVVFTVKPEFVIPEVNAQVLAELQKSVMAGTISAETYWQYLTTGKLPERAYDEEAGLISDERESTGLNLDDDNGNRDPTGTGRADPGAGDAA